jgi:hypothetical protein
MQITENRFIAFLSDQKPFRHRFPTLGNVGCGTGLSKKQRQEFGEREALPPAADNDGIFLRPIPLAEPAGRN